MTHSAAKVPRFGSMSQGAPIEFAARLDHDRRVYERCCAINGESKLDICAIEEVRFTTGASVWCVLRLGGDDLSFHTWWKIVRPDFDRCVPAFKTTHADEQ